MTNGGRAYLLRSSVRAAAAQIVAARLDAAASAAERLLDRKDKDALHDFRVGIRRLRSALRAYRPWLGKASSRKLRARLGDIARSTDRDRDAEVQAVWIRDCRRNAPDEVRTELSEMLRHMGRHAQPRRKLLEAFASVEKKLRERLRSIAPGGPRFHVVYAGLVAEYVSQAAGWLETVIRADQAEEAHKARIAVKRLRYLLEPLVSEIPELPAYIDALASLQDLLGELHDAQVFAEQQRRTLRARIGEIALGLLESLNEERRSRVFDLLRTQWLRGEASRLFSDVRRLIPEPLMQN